MFERLPQQLRLISSFEGSMATIQSIFMTFRRSSSHSNPSEMKDEKLGSQPPTLFGNAFKQKHKQAHVIVSGEADAALFEIKQASRVER